MRSLNSRKSILGKKVGDKWELITRELAYFRKISKKRDDYSKTTKEPNKDNYFSALTRKIPSHERIGRTNKITQEFNSKTIKDFAMVC